MTVGTPALLVLLLSLLFLPNAAMGAGFSLGVAAGEVEATQAKLWAHADQSGPVSLELVRRGRVVQRHRATASPADDNTVQVMVRRLRPGTRYRYRFRSGSYDDGFSVAGVIEPYCASLRVKSAGSK